jgi:hypothetical protein
MIITQTSVYFVMLISITLDAQFILPRHDLNENQCLYCNIILGQVTLSPTGSHLLHCKQIQKKILFTPLFLPWENVILKVDTKPRNTFNIIHDKLCAYNTKYIMQCEIHIILQSTHT